MPEETTGGKATRRTYRPPVVKTYDEDEIWREMGPAQAITPDRRLRRNPAMDFPPNP